MSMAELRAQAEQLRRSARLQRTASELVRFNADLKGCDVCRQRADGSDALAGTCEAAADLMLKTIEVYEAAHRLVHGLPPQPRGPTLKVVNGDGTTPPSAA
jgi:hypothetical protein